MERGNVAKTAQKIKRWGEVAGKYVKRDSHSELTCVLLNVKSTGKC